MFPKYPPVESVTILLIYITLGNSLQNHHLFIKKIFFIHWPYFILHYEGNRIIATYTNENN